MFKVLRNLSIDEKDTKLLMSLCLSRQQAVRGNDEFWELKLETPEISRV